MRIGRWITYIFLLILILNIVYSEGTMTPEDRAYIDGVNQKTIAQINAKIDAQSNAIERDLREQVNVAKEELRVSITNEMKGALKGIAVGLSGIILVIMAIFRIFDLKFNYTNKIKKYEKELEDKTKEYKDLYDKTQKQYHDNEKLKRELNIYKESLDKYAVSLGIKPQFNIEKQHETFDINKPPTPDNEIIKKKFNVKNIIIISIISIIVIVLSIIFLGRYF